MRLLDKLLGKIKPDKPEAPEKEEPGKFMPQVKTPIDDRFILNFKHNGGKFLYCTTTEEVQITFKEILNENTWNGESCCFDQNLKNLFSEHSLNFTANTEAPFCLLTCEYLIANSGALLMSSNQIGEKKLSNLPYNMVVYAATSQIVEILGEGLQRIKARDQDIPSNITTIKNFKQNTGDNEHFLSYGTTTKNVYLLLLEDL